MNFKYESVPTFCFICGLMGHNEKFCHKIFDMPLEKIEKLYGIWMKAEPQRRNHTIGSKWLRQGFQTQGESPVNDMAGKNGGGIEVQNKSNPLFLGDQIISVKTNCVNEGRGYAGSDKAEITGSNSKLGEQGQSANLAVNNQVDIGLEENIDCGLHIAGPKRRRVEDNIGVGLSLQNSEVDTTMIDSQEANKDQKNGLPADTAVQARLEL